MRDSILSEIEVTLYPRWLVPSLDFSKTYETNFVVTLLAENKEFPVKLRIHDTRITIALFSLPAASLHIQDTENAINMPIVAKSWQKSFYSFSFSYS